MDVVENRKYSEYREINQSCPNLMNVAPTLPIPVDLSDDTSDESPSDDSDEDVQWKRKKKSTTRKKQTNRLSARSEPFTLSATEFQSSRHPPSSTPQTDKPNRDSKRNNVWCNVLSEQMLTEDIQGCGVQRLHTDDGREVESYAYWRKHQMDEPPPPRQEAIISGSSNRRKRKKIPLMTYGSDDTDESLGNRIAAKLQEAKTDLIVNVVRELGKDKAVKLLQKTEEVERMGGLLTVQGDRRRTAGGVFFRVLKEDPHITRVQMDEIFAEEKKEADEKRKKLKAVTRQKKFAKFKNLLEAENRMEVPLPTVQDMVLQNAMCADASSLSIFDTNATDVPVVKSQNLPEEELEPGEIVDDDDDDNQMS